MLSLICAAFLSLPLYPLNPTAQDTVSSMNIHLAVGVSGQSAMISAGPEFSIKYEYLFNHPFIFRSSLDYLYGEIQSNNHPNGSVHRQAISTEVVYYRGTKAMTAYLGIGFVYGRGSFEFDDNDYFRLKNIPKPDKIIFDDAFGYRLLLGLRFKHKYSLEVAITEISPSFIYYYDTGVNTFSEQKFQFRANYFKVALGYFFKLK